MSKIDYTKIITIDELKVLTKEQYQEAVHLGEAQRLKINKAYSLDDIRTGQPGSQFDNITVVEAIAHELYRLKCQNMCEAQRTVVACAFSFHSETFVKKLLDDGYNYFTLFHLARLIRKAKEIKTKQMEGFEREIAITDLTLKKLCKSMVTYFGIHDYNFILSKLCQVVWFEKDLIEQTKLNSYNPVGEKTKRQ